MREGSCVVRGAGFLAQGELGEVQRRGCVGGVRGRRRAPSKKASSRRRSPSMMVCSSPQIPGGSGTSGSSCARSPNAVLWSPEDATTRPMAQRQSEWARAADGRAAAGLREARAPVTL